MRFVFSDITPESFKFEQAFSDDGGKTWEPNWIATFTPGKAVRRQCASQSRLPVPLGYIQIE